MAIMIHYNGTYTTVSVSEDVEFGAVGNILVLSSSVLAAVVAISYIYYYFRKPTLVRAAFSFIVLAVLFPLVLAVASRTRFYTVVFCVYLLIVMYIGAIKRNHLLIVFVIIVVGWFAVRGIKDSRSMASQGVSIDANDLGLRVAAASMFDLGYRLGGLDFPSALWEEQIVKNKPPMFGRDAWFSLLGDIPHVLWPGKPRGGEWDPKELIYEAYGVDDWMGVQGRDQIMTPFSSAFADFGWIGTPILISLSGGGLCAIQHYILRMRYGIMMYFCLLPSLFEFEVTIVQYLMLYLRFAVMFWIIIEVVRSLVKSPDLTD